MTHHLAADLGRCSGRPHDFRILTDIPVTVKFSYYIPHANAYDWSLPPLSVDSNEGTWGETINPDTGQPAQQLIGEVQALEVTGANRVAQANDNQNTFISGLLFGLAGAAAVVALQEFLHLVFKVE
jgi:hypothetical protein